MCTRLEADLAELNRLLTEGQALLDEGRYEEAVDRFDQCLLKDPYGVPAVEGLATAHERLGHHQQATDLHKQAELIRHQLCRQQPAPEAVLG
jgi:Flp pilus assembly protein TadD